MIKKRNCLFVFNVLLIFTLLGCALTQEKSSDNLKNITEKDFDIYYRNNIINDEVPLKKIATELGFAVGETNDDIYCKVSTENNGNEYGWYVVHYPSENNEEIRIEYLRNETLKIEYLVSIELFNASASTSRNISVGDNFEKLINAYGDDVERMDGTSTTYTYSYMLDTELGKGITMTTFRDTGKIMSIYIDYGSNKAIEEAGIVAFD